MSEPELFSSNRGVLHFCAACCFNVLSRVSGPKHAGASGVSVFTLYHPEYNQQFSHFYHHVLWCCPEHGQPSAPCRGAVWQKKESHSIDPLSMNCQQKKALLSAIIINVEDKRALLECMHGPHFDYVDWLALIERCMSCLQGVC